MVNTKKLLATRIYKYKKKIIQLICTEMITKTRILLYIYYYGGTWRYMKVHVRNLILEFGMAFTIPIFVPFQLMRII